MRSTRFVKPSALVDRTAERTRTNLLAVLATPFAPRKPRLAAGLRDTDDVEGDCGVLAGEGDDRHCVEQLVIAEHARERVGSPQCVDNSAGGLREATRGDEDDRRDALAVRELREGEDADPAERYSEDR